MTEKFDLILQKLDRMDGRLEKLEAGFVRLEERQEKLEAGFTRLEARQEKLELRQAKVEEGQTIIVAELTEMKMDIAIIKEKVNDNLIELRSHVKYVENMQERQQRVIEMLSYRSIEHETEINSMKRTISN